METAKSQLRLRSLDAGGRPLGTDRPSLLPSSGTGFGTRLAQGLAEVQEEQARTRRVRDERISEQAAERDRRAARDQEARAGSSEERRSSGDQRLAERRVERREQDRRLAEGRREASNERRVRSGETRSGEAAPPRPDEAPREAPVAGQHVRPDEPVRSAGRSPDAGAPRPPQATPAPAPATSPAGPAPSANGGTAGTVASAASPGRSSAGTQPAPNPAAAAPDRATGPNTPVSSRRASAPPPAAPDVERAEAVLRQVRIALQPGLRGASLQLQPAELGRVTIRLRLRDDGVHAVVRAESEATLGVLERHLPELRAMLAQQGFEGAEFDLGLAGGEAQGDPDTPRRGERAGAPLEEETDLDPLALARPLRAAEGGIDLIA